MAIIAWLGAHTTLAKAQDNVVDHAAALEQTQDKDVDVELKSGSKLADVKVVEIGRDPKTKVIRSLKIQPPTGAKRTLTLSTIKIVTLDGETVYDAAVVDAKKKIKLTKEEKEKLAAEQAAERHKLYLARLEARGVKPWPELSDEEHKQTIDDHKKLIEEMGKVYPGMQFVETKNFMVYTNIPPEQMRPYVVSLDEMYTMMCKMYRLPADARVFRGKALIVAFLNEAEFQDSEQRFFGGRGPQGAYGVCHSYSSGKVVVCCYRGNNPKAFGSMLVHETSHGFIHRYKTPVDLPSWVNEGMADYIADVVVPGVDDAGVAAAITRVRQQRNLGGNYYTLNSNIEFWQYGIALSMTRFLIKLNTDAYVTFIEDMKEGMPWDEALRKNYNATPDELTATFGATIGVPDLVK
ncbi:MAG TPA: hypothetical protein VGE52_17645 [Pirellulales bacterium]